MLSDKPKKMTLDISSTFVHIGFHKTGTSFLQKNIFWDKDQPFCSPWTVDSGEIIEHFVITNPRKFNPGQIRQHFLQDVLNANCENLVPTISHEALSGNALRGRYYGFDVASRLKKVFPTARILIVIREQRSMLRSSYNQYVMQGGMFSIEDFIGGTLKRVGFSPIFRLDYLEYDLLISEYIEFFGRDSVLVLPQELLRLNPSAFLDKIYSFVEVEAVPNSGPQVVNASLGAATVEVRRLLNSLPGRVPPIWKDHSSTPLLWRLKGKICGYLDKIIPSYLDKRAENYVKQYIAKHVGDYYVDSNRKLQSYVNFDLKEMGYHV